MSEENKKLASRFFDELHSQSRLEPIEELSAPEYEAVGERSQAKGYEAVKQSLMSRRSEYPDYSVQVEEQIAEDDKVVTRVSFSGCGRAWEGVAIQRMSNGKIVETWRMTNR